MPIEWPAALPDFVLVDGYAEMMPDNVLFGKMEIGPPKARRRSTAALQLITAKIYVDIALAATFMAFYTDTLMDGSLSFDWEHPRTGDAATMRFMSPPVITPVSGTDFYIQMQLGIYP